MRKVDIFISLVIGELAGLLMVFISKNIVLSGRAAESVWLLPFVFPFFTLAVMILGRLVSRKIAVAYQLSKFLLVGGLNFLIDLGVLNVLILATGVASGALAVGFKVAAFSVAVSSSFFWNKFWTFRAISSEGLSKDFIEFITVSLIGLGLNAGIFWLVNDFVGPQAAMPPATWANISALIAAIIGLMWNFLGYKFIVFRKPKGQA